uniref:Uncharacterized protein n=1 Tax=Arundo donax TaxID=35708 RepID=A0A0A8ZMG7_ARUDO
MLLIFSNLSLQKKLNLWGLKSALGHSVKEDILTQVKKTSEPLPHSYTALLPVRTTNNLGWALNLCFGVGQTMRFF